MVEFAHFEGEYNNTSPFIIGKITTVTAFGRELIVGMHKF